MPPFVPPNTHKKLRWTLLKRATIMSALTVGGKAREPSQRSPYMNQETPAIKLRLRLVTMTQARTRLAVSLRSDTDIELNSRMYVDSVRNYRQALQEMVATFQGA